MKNDRFGENDINKINLWNSPATAFQTRLFNRRLTDSKRKPTQKTTTNHTQTFFKFVSNRWSAIDKIIVTITHAYIYPMRIQYAVHPVHVNIYHLDVEIESAISIGMFSFPRSEFCSFSISFLAHIPTNLHPISGNFFFIKFYDACKHSDHNTYSICNE